MITQSEFTFFLWTVNFARAFGVMLPSAQHNAWYTVVLNDYFSVECLINE